VEIVNIVAGYKEMENRWLDKGRRAYSLKQYDIAMDCYEKAIAEGKFKEEIVPVEVKKKKETIIFDTDEGPRKGVTVESISGLKPAFKKDGGVVTAANSSGINDAASAIIVMSEEKAKELGVKPLGTWIAGELAGVEPSIMGIGPVAATQKVMKKA
jgi:acetyl-CoA C-acetyltransferase